MLAGALAASAGACGSVPGQAPTTPFQVEPYETPTSRSAPFDSPTPSPASKQEQAEASIRLALTRYYSLQADISNGGYRNWEILLPWWETPELTQKLTGEYERLQEREVYTTGRPRIIVERISWLEPGDLTQAVVSLCWRVNSYELLHFGGEPIPGGLVDSLYARYLLEYRPENPVTQWVMMSLSEETLEC